MHQLVIFYFMEKITDKLNKKRQIIQGTLARKLTIVYTFKSKQ